jgi:hypothetical protein
MASNSRKRTRGRELHRRTGQPPSPAKKRASPATRRAKNRRRRERPTAGKTLPSPASLQRERRTLLDEPEPPTETPDLAETAHPGARLERARGAIHGLTGGDLDANWEQAYTSGDEIPGGDNPTPDQDRVDDIGRALGVRYADEEELVGSDKIIERDRHRWELDPASAEDFGDRVEPEEEAETPDEDEA